MTSRILKEVSSLNLVEIFIKLFHPAQKVQDEMFNLLTCNLS